MLIIGLLVFTFTFILCSIGFALALGIKTTTGSTQDVVEFLGSAPSRKGKTIRDYETKLRDPTTSNKEVRPPSSPWWYLGPKVADGFYITIPGLHQSVARINVTPQVLEFAQPDEELIDVRDGAVRITLRCSFQVINTHNAYYNISEIREEDNPGDLGYREELQSLLDSVLRKVIKEHYSDAELDVIRMNMDDTTKAMLEILCPNKDDPDQLENAGLALKSDPTKLEMIGLYVMSLDITDVQPSKEAIKAIEQKFIARQQAAIRQIEAKGLVDAANELASAQGISQEAATKQILEIQKLETIRNSNVSFNVTSIGDDIMGAVRVLAGNVGGN